MALESKQFAVDELQVYIRNPRRGDVDAIAQSLTARGQYRAIAVNIGTLTGRPFEVLAGNHTLLAARKLGWTHLSATTVDVDEAEAARIVAADNRLADLGSYDDEDLLAVLEQAGELMGTGYSVQDLAELQAALHEPIALTDPDDAPAVDDTNEPVSRPGDVWHLGPHRLYVGSAGDTEAVVASAQAEVACIWTDPPYGVNYVGGTGMTIQNDSEDEAAAVFRDAVPTMVAVARPGAPIYVAHSDVVRIPFQRALEAHGVKLRQTLIWVKDSLVLGRADYHWKHEPILHGELDDQYDPIAYGFTPDGVGRLGRGGDSWHGDNRQTTVLEVARPKASRLHPTMKPVNLIVPMLQNSCPVGGLVFDCFAGSGSTLIAAHIAGMIALLCELDPKYADVICRRWEEHTGIVPERGGVPTSFREG